MQSVPAVHPCYTRNIPFLRDKEPSQPVLGLLPCDGISFPAPSLMYIPVLFKHLHINGPQACPHFLYFRLQEEGSGSFHCSTKWGAYSHTAHVHCGSDAPATGDRHIARAWILCTLSPLAVSKHCTPFNLVCMLSLLSNLESGTGVSQRLFPAL